MLNVYGKKLYCFSLKKTNVLNKFLDTYAPPRPPPPSGNDIAPPRPPPPAETDDEYEMPFPTLQPYNPIMVISIFFFFLI